MNQTEAIHELLPFFKALSDENRLKIIGLLAQRPRSVEELASLLDLSASTTSHHLARLSQAGLVGVRVDGHYYYYHLDLENLRKTSERLLRDESLSRLAENLPEDAYPKKVLSAFLDPAGRIKTFPAQDKKLQVLLRYVLAAFEPGRRYSEKEVNEIMLRFNEDTAFLRRSMIEYRLMEREGGGGDYWVKSQA